MTLPLKKLPLFTPEQYLERECAANERSEYHNGLIFAMAGGSIRHSLLAGNIFGEFKTAFIGRDCAVVFSEVKIVAPNQTSFFYPDIVVLCGQTFSQHRDIAESPSVIVEVLSPSTRAYDLTTKREVYQRIPSLHTLICVDSTKREVLLLERDSKGKWPKQPSRPAKNLALKHLDATIPIDAIYAGINFAES
jgi:Uma2 family endonuclease